MMNKKLNENLNKFKEMAGITVASIAKFTKDCQEQDKRIAAQRAAAMCQTATDMQIAALQPEHMGFGDAVGRCLQNEHDTCGLKIPHRYEDICCDDSTNSIRINAGGLPDFVYEAKRDYSNVGSLNDIMNGRSKSVSTADIEKILNRTLGKYTNHRGYSFSRVVVDDIGNGKVRITAQDVTLTSAERQRRWGC